MFADRLITDGSLKRTDDGFSVEIRLNWYRSLPLSCIREVTLTVDGARVEPESSSIVVDGVEYHWADLPEHIDTFWFVGDPAELRVRRAEPLEPGLHEVELTLSSRIPYVVVAVGNDNPAEACLFETNTCAKSLAA